MIRKWLFYKIIKPEVDKIAMELLCHSREFKEIEPGVIFKGRDYCSYRLVIGYYGYIYSGKKFINYNWVERQYIKWVKNQWRDHLMRARLDRFK